MIKNITYFVTGLLLFFLIGIFAANYYLFVAPKKEITEKCQGFVPNWMDFVDCHGVIAVNDGWDMDYLSIKDHIHRYEIARVYTKNQYLYEDEKIFVINKKIIEGTTTNAEHTRYYQMLFKNGELVTDYYENVFDIPMYMIIDTGSGNVDAYRTIDEIPEGQREHFFQLQNMQE